MNTQQGLREENGALGNAWWATLLRNAQQYSCVFLSLVFPYFLCREFKHLDLEGTNAWVAVATSKLESQSSLLGKF